MVISYASLGTGHIFSHDSRFKLLVKSIDHLILLQLLNDHSNIGDVLLNDNRLLLKIFLVIGCLDSFLLSICKLVLLLNQLNFKFCFCEDTFVCLSWY